MAAVAGIAGAVAGIGSGLLHRAQAQKSFDKALAAANSQAGAAPLPSPEEIARGQERQDDMDAIAQKLLGLPLTREETRKLATKLRALIEKLEKSGGKLGAGQLDKAVAGFVAETKSKYMLSEADASHLTQVAKDYASAKMA